jgi:hypothetical protein
VDVAGRILPETLSYWTSDRPLSGLGVQESLLLNLVIYRSIRGILFFWRTRKIERRIVTTATPRNNIFTNIVNADPKPKRKPVATLILFVLSLKSSFCVNQSRRAGEANKHMRKTS